MKNMSSRVGFVLSLAVLSIAPQMSSAAMDGGRWGATGGSSQENVERRSEVVKFTRSEGSCSPMHQAAVFNAVAECQVRSTMVELPLPDTRADEGSILQLIPGKNLIGI